MLRASSEFWIILLSTLLVSCSEQNLSQINDTDCKVAIESADGDVKFIDAHFLDISKGLSFRLPSNLNHASSILCNRSNLILKTTDFLVVIGEMKPLMLVGRDAKVVLEMVNGQLRMRVLDGQLSESQIAAAQNAMNKAQSIHQGE